MNARLKEILARVAKWPEEEQGEVVRVLQAMEQAFSEPLSPEDVAAVEEGLEDERQGRFASPTDMRALFDRYRNG